MESLVEFDDSQRFGGGGDRRMTAVAGDEQLPDVSRPGAGEPSMLCCRNDNQYGEFKSTEEDVGGLSQSMSNAFKVAFRAVTSQFPSDGDADETL